MTGQAPQLPPPTTGVEIYLAAVHQRLGEILDRLPVAPDGGGEPHELREPRTPPAAAKSGQGAVPRRPARTPRASSKKGGGT